MDALDSVFDPLRDFARTAFVWSSDATSLIANSSRRWQLRLRYRAKHRKPRKVTLHGMLYSCGVFGISVCSLWLLRHSKLMGSSDIDNWISEANDSTVSFGRIT